MHDTLYYVAWFILWYDAQFIVVRNPDDPTAADKFAEVATAYEVLIDKDKRRIYDTQGQLAFCHIVLYRLTTPFLLLHLLMFFLMQNKQTWDLSNHVVSIVVVTRIDHPMKQTSLSLSLSLSLALSLFKNIYPVFPFVGEEGLKKKQNGGGGGRSPFDMFFGGNRRRDRGEERGPDIELDLFIKLKDL